jgi:hypothetical protein
VKRLLAALLCFALLPVALGAELKHTETLQVGSTKVTVGFTEFPMRAERSLDLTFNPEGGIAGKSGRVRLVQPDGETYFTSKRLPRFPRDRSIWGFDSIALPKEGTWKLELTVNGSTGSLPLNVLERPAGPPSNLILALAAIPILAVLVIAVRGWASVRPLRKVDSRSW